MSVTENVILEQGNFDNINQKSVAIFMKTFHISSTLFNNVTKY